MNTLTKKRQIGIRIPCELDKRLEACVSEIGISKPAFILGLIYKELKKEDAAIVHVKRPAQAV